MKHGYDLADAPDDNVTFTPKRLAEFELWESLHRTAWGICMDPSPSVQSQLDMLHVLSAPHYRKDPEAGAAAARAMIADMGQGHTSYRDHLGKVVAAFDAYATIVGRRKRPLKRQGTKREFNVQSVDRDLGF